MVRGRSHSLPKPQPTLWKTIIVIGTLCILTRTLQTGSGIHAWAHAIPDTKGSISYTLCSCFFHLIIVKRFPIFHRTHCFLNYKGILLWPTQMPACTYTNSKNKIFLNGILISGWQQKFKIRVTTCKNIFNNKNKPNATLEKNNSTNLLTMIANVNSSTAKQLISWFLHLANLWRCFPYGYVLFECFLK